MNAERQARRSSPIGPPSPLGGRAPAWRLRSGRRFAPASEGGFTLLELIVATTIFSIVIAAAYSLFDSARGVTSRAELRAQLFQTARMALQSIEDDLRGAVMVASPTPTDLAFIGTSVGSEKQGYDRLEFVSVSRHTASAYDVNVTDVVRGIDVAKVLYWIEQDTAREKHGLVRERPKELLPPGGPVRREEDVVEIARDVVHLNIRYYDAGEWRDTWDSSQLRKLPKAIEVTVVVRAEWRDEEVLEPFTSRFYLPVAAETPERPQQ
jgi:general secretion pathway protein J